MIRPAQMSVCAAKVASRLFLDGAQPALLTRRAGGPREYSRESEKMYFRFIHIFIDRPTAVRMRFARRR
jgi:hypothetical protein